MPETRLRLINASWERERRAREWLGTGLAGVLAFGILTLWVPGQWPVSAVQIGIYALTAAWLGGVVVRGFSVRWSALMIPLAGTVLWGCLQLALGATVYRWATEVAVLDWFTRFAVFFLALQVFVDEELRERCLRWAVWFGLVVSLVAVLQRFTSPEKIFWLFDKKPHSMPMGPFVYHNQFAAFVETVLPLALVGAIRDREKCWLYLVMAGGMIASVVTAVSRAGAAMILVETVVLFLLMWRRRLYRVRLGPAAAAVAALSLLFTVSVGWEPLRGKFGREDQLAERRELMLSTIEMARAKPLMGFGLGTWSVAYPAYARFDDGKFDNQAHNDWLQWASEGGLPFLGLMLAIAGLLAPPAVRTGWGIGLLAVLVHCLVDYHFQQRPAFGYWWFAMAGLVCAAAAQDHGDRAREDV